MKKYYLYLTAFINRAIFVIKRPQYLLKYGILGLLFMGYEYDYWYNKKKDL